jgi:hypothetical protein
MEVINQMLLGLVKGLPTWARHYGVPTLSGLHSLNEQAAVHLKPFPVRQPVVGPVSPTATGLTRAFPVHTRTVRNQNVLARLRVTLATRMRSFCLASRRCSATNGEPCM